jgi:hypothetical protein|tara:strand:- start:573 stop:1196 length:624 start_codon:yes stop_codon:yes gene_type:complete
MSSDYTLAIDPGPVKSGWITWGEGTIWKFGHTDNDKLIEMMEIEWANWSHLVIEDVSHYGPDITVGKDVFDTCKWMGRFDQFNRDNEGAPTTYISRPDIKLHLLGVRRGTDSQVRMALIDKYGGEREAIGGIKCKTCKGKGWNGRGRPACLDCHHVYEAGADQSRQYPVGCGYEVHPGPLHGVTTHVWSALAVLQTYLDQQDTEVPM